MSKAVVLSFEAEAEFLEALEAARREGVTVIDAFVPYMPEGVDGGPDAGAGAGVVTLAMVVGGFTVAILFYVLEWWTSTLGYPINSGGRPTNSWPTFLTGPLEFGVFAAALSGVVTWIARCGLPTPYHPVFDLPEIERASQDRFFLALQAGKPADALARVLKATPVARVKL